ncbi:MAG: hypothetical protein AAF984_01965, partial [Verrucomicrobiota bacterium]
ISKKIKHMNKLWNKLKDFKVDQGNESLTFIDRLARENNWSINYTRRVFNEYLKFIYLAATGSTPATPSDQVDQAWHLHLCYSNSYWNDLCKNILGKNIQHGPTKGGNSENKKFELQYLDTLNRYEKFFGEKPSEDIWPQLEKRFDCSNRYIRVNLRDSFIIPKKVVYLISSLALSTLILAGCKDVINNTIKDNPVLIVIGIILTFFFVPILISKFFKPRTKRKDKADSSGCSSYGGGGCASGGDSCGSGCGGGCGGS